jgi:hypothetical protein
VIADDKYFDLFMLFEKSVRKIGFPIEPTRLYLPPDTPINAEREWFLKKNLTVSRSRPLGVEKWGNWACCEAYYAILKDIAADPMIGDDDYVMDADADTVFLNAKVFGQIDGSDIIGLPCYNKRKDFPKYGVRDWVHFSGCFILYRGGFLRRLANAGDDQIAETKEYLKNDGFFCDDTFTAFLTMVLGGRVKYIGWEETVASNPESVILGKTKSNASIIHWEGGTDVWKNFLGIPIKGKCDIPRAIRESGIDLP